MNDLIKQTLDWIAYSTAVAVIFKLIPAIAGLFSIIWLGIQIRDRIKYGPHKKG